jgi:hypothetical protein
MSNVKWQYLISQSDNILMLTQGLKVLWLSGTDNRGYGRISESLPPSPDRDQHQGNFCGSAPRRNQHRGNFAARLLGTILGLPAINLSRSFLPSPKAAPGVLAIAFQ